MWRVPLDLLWHFDERLRLIIRRWNVTQSIIWNFQTPEMFTNMSLSIYEIFIIKKLYAAHSDWPRAKITSAICSVIYLSRELYGQGKQKSSLSTWVLSSKNKLRTIKPSSGISVSIFMFTKCIKNSIKVDAGVNFDSFVTASQACDHNHNMLRIYLLIHCSFGWDVNLLSRTPASRESRGRDSGAFWQSERLMHERGRIGLTAAASSPAVQ